MDKQEKDLQEFESRKMTRRSALRKLGLTSGAVAGMFFFVDDLARMMLRKMEEHSATREIAEITARDFRNVGIAFADGTSGTTTTNCTPASIANTCQTDPNHGGYATQYDCMAHACGRCYPPVFFSANPDATNCLNAAEGN